MALTPEEIAELTEFDEALGSGEYPSDIKRGRAIHLPIEEGESAEEYLTRLFNTGCPNLGQTPAAERLRTHPDRRTPPSERSRPMGAFTTIVV